MKPKQSASLPTKPRGRPPKMIANELKKVQVMQKKLMEEKKKFEEEKNREEKRLEEKRKREEEEKKRKEEDKKREEEQKKREKEQKKREEEEKKREKEQKKREEEQKKREEKKRLQRQEKEDNEREKKKKYETPRNDDNRGDADNQRYYRPNRRFGDDNRGRRDASITNRNRSRPRECSPHRFRNFSPEVERRDCHRFTSRSPVRYTPQHNNEEMEVLRFKILQLEHTVTEHRQRERKHEELQQSTVEYCACTKNNNDEISKLKTRIRHYQQNNADLKKKLDTCNKKLAQIECQPPFVSSYQPPHNFSEEYGESNYYYNY